MTKWWFFVKYKVYKIVVKCANTRAKSDSAYKIMALSVFVISTESWPAQVILKTYLCAVLFSYFHCLSRLYPPSVGKQVHNHFSLSTNKSTSI